VARVVFPDHLLTATGGVRELEVSAENVRELLLALADRFPGSESVLAKSAIAIDGQIYQDAYLEPIGPDSEVFFMLRLEGG
jgi:molybdopterin synthase sulfur carrier subunit